VRADQQTLTELLRCLPVTQEAAGSSSVAPAIQLAKLFSAQGTPGFFRAIRICLVCQQTTHNSPAAAIFLGTAFGDT
jgi:hypothetical protein